MNQQILLTNIHEMYAQLLGELTKYIIFYISPVCPSWIEQHSVLYKNE